MEKMLYGFKKAIFTKSEVQEYILKSDKDIIFTLGLDYKNPCHYKEKVSAEQAVNYMKEYLSEVAEYDDYIYVHCYTANDLF